MVASLLERSKPRHCLLLAPLPLFFCTPNPHLSSLTPHPLFLIPHLSTITPYLDPHLPLGPGKGYVVLLGTGCGVPTCGIPVHSGQELLEPQGSSDSQVSNSHLARLWVSHSAQEDALPRH